MINGNAEFQCPVCGYIHNVTYHTMIEANDTDLKNQIMDGTLFKHTCPKCQKTYTLSYAFSFIDPDKKILLTLAKTQMAEAMFEMETKDLPNVENWTRRVVKDLNDMREKILIIDHNLDDRVIEMIKCSGLEVVLSQNPDFKSEEAHCFPEDEVIHFEYYGYNLSQTYIKKVLSFDMSMEEYNGFKSEVTPVLTMMPDEHVIDFEWALNTMSDNEMLN